MKIAFCLFKYFPFGGMQRDFLCIARECIRRGHQVDVFTMSWEGEQEPTITVTLVPVTARQNHTRAQQFVTQLKPLLQGYDIVVGFDKVPGLDIYYAADTCYQAKIKQQRPAWYRLLPRCRQRLRYEKAVFNAAAKTNILLLSPAQQVEFMHFYKTPVKRFHLLPPGIAKDRIAPKNANDIREHTRTEYDIKKNDFLILMVGSGFKTKGLDRILVSYSALPDHIRKKTKVFVIGQDNPTLFQKQAKRLGMLENVVFLGGRNDIPRFLLAADILLHPAYNENTGTILLEALAAGLPVLTTDVCGYASYIHSAKAGVVLTSPFQQIECNRALAMMLSANEKRISWHQNAIEFAKHADIYSLTERAVDIMEIYHKA